MKRKLFNSISIGIFFCMGVALSFGMNKEAYPTTVVVFEDGNVYENATPATVRQGTTLKGVIKATHGNFATVKLRVFTLNRINSTHITFRIKEKGASEWISTNEYAVDRFPDGMLYPFGFEKIASSSGKTYEFEIISPDGTSDNAIRIADGYHSVASQYVFSKSELINDKQLLKTFIAAKAGEIFDPYFIVFYLLWFVPMVFTIISLFSKRKNQRERMAIVCFFYIVAAYVFLPISMSTNAPLAILLMFVAISWVGSISYTKSFLFALMFLVCIPFGIFFNMAYVANRTATVAYILSVSGLFLSMVKHHE